MAAILKTFAGLNFYTRTCLIDYYHISFKKSHQTLRPRSCRVNQNFDISWILDLGLPANFQKLKASEDTLDSVIAEAKTEWTQELCDKITYAGSSKEIWEHFNSLTTYQDHSGGGVLPLIDRNGKPVFDRQEKC